MEQREYTICPLVSKGFGSWETAVCNDACAWYDVSTQGCIMQGIARSLKTLAATWICWKGRWKNEDRGKRH